MTVEVEVRTRINRPLAEVFAYMADFSHIPDDDLDVHHIKRVNDVVGLGEKWTMKRTQAMVYTFDASLEVIAFEPNKLIEIRSAGSGFEVRASQHYTAIDDNTTEIYEQMRMQLKGPRRLVEALVGQTLPGQGRKVHDRIKDRLEGTLQD